MNEVRTQPVSRSRASVFFENEEQTYSFNDEAAFEIARVDLREASRRLGTLWSGDERRQKGLRVRRNSHSSSNRRRASSRNDLLTDISLISSPSALQPCSLVRARTLLSSSSSFSLRFLSLLSLSTTPHFPLLSQRPSTYTHSRVSYPELIKSVPPASIPRGPRRFRRRFPR